MVEWQGVESREDWLVVVEELEPGRQCDSLMGQKVVEVEED